MKKYFNKISVFCLSLLFMLAGQQLSGQCIDTRTVDAGDAVTVSDGAATLNAAYTTEYVLLDLATGTVAAVNATGDFTADLVAGGSYQIHILNYDPADAPAGAPVAVGAAPTDVTGGCFDAGFTTEFVCVTVNPIVVSNCLATQTFCEGDPIQVSAGGTENTAYTTEYALVDATTGLVIDANTTGAFTAGVDGDSYQIHVLNYDPLDPPAGVPLAAGADPAAVTGGCFDADFLTEFICVTVEECVLPVCDIAVAITNFVCDTGVDPADPADDTVSFDYTVTDTGGTGTTWSSDQGDLNVAYGTTVNVTGLVADGTMWMINITEDDAVTNPNCTATASQTLSSCSNATDIPTLSEWGLITLALMLMSYGSVVMAGAGKLAGTSNAQIPMGFQLPFNAAILRKAFMFTGILALMGYTMSIVLFGAIFFSDIIGVAIAGPVFAYLAHLLYLIETNKEQ